MDCTCNGNSNCYRCDGTGYVREEPAASLVKATAKQTRKHVILATDHPKECPSCKRMIKASLLKEHLAKYCNKPVVIYSKSQITAPIKPKVKQQLMQGEVQCPQCAAVLRNKSRLEKHLSKKCRYRANRDIVQKPKRKKAPTKIIHIHNTPPSHKDNGSGSGKGLASGSPQPKKAAIFDERLLDGSKGYHNHRENGRFGSHSSHDDYGEEAYF